MRGIKDNLSKITKTLLDNRQYEIALYEVAIWKETKFLNLLINLKAVVKLGT